MIKDYVTAQERLYFPNKVVTFLCEMFWMSSFVFLFYFVIYKVTATVQEY